MFSSHVFCEHSWNSWRRSLSPWSLQDAEALRQRLLSEAKHVKAPCSQEAMNCYEFLWLFNYMLSKWWKLLVYNCVEPCRAPCRFLLHQSWTGYFWIARAAQRINPAKRGAMYWRHGVVTSASWTSKTLLDSSCCLSFGRRCLSRYPRLCSHSCCKHISINSMMIRSPTVGGKDVFLLDQIPNRCPPWFQALSAMLRESNGEASELRCLDHIHDALVGKTLWPHWNSLELPN